MTNPLSFLGYWTFSVNTREDPDKQKQTGHSGSEVKEDKCEGRVGKARKLSGYRALGMLHASIRNLDPGSH